MRWARPGWLFLLGSCILAAGCLPATCRRDCPDCCTGRAPCGVLALDPGEVVLTPDQVQDAAIRSTGMGDALEVDARAEDGGGCGGCGQGGGRRGQLARELKAYAADEVRNQTAYYALQAYYRLAEAHGQANLANEALQVADNLVAQARELQSKGLPVPTDLDRLFQQRSEVVTDALKVELVRSRLTEQIRQLMKDEVTACRIGTVEVFHVLDEPIDEKEAILIGLKYRPDLNLLRTALCRLDASSLPLVHQLLGGLNSLLSGPAGRCLPMLDCLQRLIPCLAEREIEKVRKQIEALLCERERQAVSEIRQALGQIRLRGKLAGEARLREQLGLKRIAAVEEKMRRGLPADGEMPVARKDLIKVRVEMLHEVIEWELARVGLRKAQGLLVREREPRCEKR